MRSTAKPRERWGEYTPAPSLRQRLVQHPWSETPRVGDGSFPWSDCGFRPIVPARYLPYVPARRSRADPMPLHGGEKTRSRAMSRRVRCVIFPAILVALIVVAG